MEGFVFFGGGKGGGEFDRMSACLRLDGKVKSHRSPPSSIPPQRTQDAVDLGVGVELIDALDVHHDVLVPRPLEREVAEGLTGSAGGGGFF